MATRSRGAVPKRPSRTPRRARETNRSRLSHASPVGVLLGLVVVARTRSDAVADFVLTRAFVRGRTFRVGPGHSIGFGCERCLFVRVGLWNRLSGLADPVT